MIDAFTEGHILPMMTPAAIGRRVCWVDLDELPTSFFRFAGQLREKSRPRRIMNALGKTMVMSHAVDMQVFNSNDPELIDNLTTPLVSEIVTTELNPLVYASYNFAVLAPLLCAFGKLGMLALHFRQDLFFLTEKARIGYLFTSGESRKGFEPDINTHLGGNTLKAQRLTFVREGDVPFVRTALVDGTGFHKAPHRAMIHHLHRANLGEGYPAIMRDGKSALRVGETIIASISLETRVSRRLTSFTSAEERFESQINTHGHVLQNLGMNAVEGGALFFQHRIGRLLLIARQSFSLLLIGSLASSQQMIVQPSALFKRLIELLLLFLCRIDPILKVFKHIRILRLNSAIVKGPVVPNPSSPRRNAPFIPMLKRQGLSGAA